MRHINTQAIYALTAKNSTTWRKQNHYH